MWLDEPSIKLYSPFLSAALLSLPQSLPLCEFNVLSDLLSFHGLAPVMLLRLNYLMVSFNNNDKNS